MNNHKLDKYFDIRKRTDTQSNPWQISDYKFNPVTFDSNDYQMQLSLVSNSMYIFLEHPINSAEISATKTVIAMTKSKPVKIAVSHDLANTWKEIPINLNKNEMIFSCFTTMNDFHILSIYNLEDWSLSRIMVLDKNFIEISSYTFDENEGKRWTWHGSWSVAQGKDGVIMYAEYPRQPFNSYPNSCILRSKNNGFTWEKVLELPSIYNTEAEGLKIRHFHACQADPFIPSRWYAFTGDFGACFLYISNDNGDTWERIEPQINLSNFSIVQQKAIYGQLLRLTGVIITEDSLWFICDQGMVIGRSEYDLFPYFARVGKSPPYEMELISKVGALAVRSLVKLDNDMFVAITEDKLAYGSIDFFIGSVKTKNVQYLGGLPVANQLLVPGTMSCSSVAAYENTFFANICRPDREFYKVDIHRTNKNKQRQDKSVINNIVQNGTLKQGCNICGATLEFMGTSSGIDNINCTKCTSKHRHRIFASIYEKFVHNEFDISKKKILHIASCKPEELMFNNFGATNRVTADARPEQKAELVLDLCNMPEVENASFDMVYACSVFKYLHDDDAAIKEIHRILTEGGRLFIQTPAMPNRDTEYTLLTEEYGAESYENKKVAQYRKFYGDEDLIAKLQRYFLVKTYYDVDIPSGYKDKWFCAIKSRKWGRV